MVVRLDESNKKNEFLRNQIFSQDEKMKSLEQELVESKVKIENLTCTKSAVDNRSVLSLLSLKLRKFISLILRGIIKKMLILLS